jgi:hypothetical protein
MNCTNLPDNCTPADIDYEWDPDWDDDDLLIDDSDYDEEDITDLTLIF